MIQDVFERLRTLQDILAKKFEIEKELQEIPRTLSTKTELLNRLKKSYIEKNTQFEAMTEQIQSLRQRMAEAEHQREAYEKQMDLIKTQREYEALDKEIRDASDKEQQLRKELQREEKLFEDMVHALEREENMIREQEVELTTEQANIIQATDEKRTELVQLENVEHEVIPGLEEEVIFKFERIIRSKSGLGIVPIRKGVCTGCHMVLPNQFVNDVRMGEGILFCPYCSRILFYQADDEDVGSTSDESEGTSLADLEDFELDDEDFEDDGDEDELEDDYEEERGSGEEEE